MTPNIGDGAATYVLFHDAQGRIFHVHKHVSFAGQHAPDDEVEAGARAALGRVGRARADAQSLLLKDLQWQHGKRYSVDVGRHALVVSPKEAQR